MPLSRVQKARVKKRQQQKKKMVVEETEYEFVEVKEPCQEKKRWKQIHADEENDIAMRKTMDICRIMNMWGGAGPPPIHYSS